MAATSEERRKVAARLRERERGWRKMGTHVNVMPDRPATQFEDMAALLGFRGWILDADIFARLADFIDPTCHMVDTDHEYEDSIRCDVCQMTFNRPWEPFKFCPNCGARVVRDDD